MKKIIVILALILMLPVISPAQDCVLLEDTATSLRLGPFLDSTDGNTAEGSLTLTQADFRLKKGEGAFAQKNDATGGTHDENGWYVTNLDETDTNTPGTLTVFVHETGALYVKETCDVLSLNAYNKLYSNSYDPAQTGDSYARLGVPTDSTISSDVIAINTGMLASFATTDNLINTAKKSIRDVVESQRGAHTIQGDEWYVDPVNGNDSNSGARENPFLTIGQAHTSATDNNHDVIYLLAGATSGITSTDEQVTISKNYLFIRGPGRDFLWKSTSNGTVIEVTGDGVELSGFRLKTHSAGVGRGIDTSGDFTKIHHLLIEQTRGDAIRVSNASWCYIENNVLWSTGQSGAGHGINIEGSGAATEWTIIKNNDIFNTAGDGVRIDNSANVVDTLIFANFFNENAGYGVNVQTNSRDTVLADNHFANNGSGDWVDNGTNSDIENNEQWAKEVTIGIPTDTTISSDIIKLQADLDNPGQYKADVSSLATSAAQTTAQTDLDILTGADGGTLATSQPNYVPATAADLAMHDDKMSSRATAARMTELDSGNLPSDLDAVVAKLPSGNISDFNETTDTVVLSSGTHNTTIGTVTNVVTVATVTNGLTTSNVNVSGGIVEANIKEIDDSASAAEMLEVSANKIYSGRTVAGTLSTTQFTSNLTGLANNTSAIGRLIFWDKTSSLAGEFSKVTAYVKATGLFTVVELTAAPIEGDKFDLR